VLVEAMPQALALAIIAQDLVVEGEPSHIAIGPRAGVFAEALGFIFSESGLFVGDLGHAAEG